MPAIPVGDDISLCIYCHVMSYVTSIFDSEIMYHSASNVTNLSSHMNWSGMESSVL